MSVEKQLRKTLEQELNMDLSGHKQLIRGEVHSFEMLILTILID